MPPGASLFAGDEEGYIYTRIGNPTIRALEDNVAELENGFGAIATEVQEWVQSAPFSWLCCLPMIMSLVPIRSTAPLAVWLRITSPVLA